MKVLIFSGFLGSGKTTALLPLARHIVETSASDRENKVMILENEVGEVGIDDAFLRSGGLKVDTLFSGCACCTVSGELVGSVLRIREMYDPEWLILETTGVAYPRKIQETLKTVCDMDSRIAVLVDASRWKRLRLPMEGLLSGQIIGADAVLINKLDLVDTATADEVEADVKAFDPGVRTVRMSALSPAAPEIWDSVLGE